MKIAVKDLRWNPFRKKAAYPVDEQKITRLIESIKATDFWDNVLVRRAPDGDGYEIAYGHHRLVALQKCDGRAGRPLIEEVDLPVKKLSNTLMIKIMANENMEEWSHRFSIEMETVRTVVEAYADGDIELEPPAPKAPPHLVRTAPGFVQGVSADVFAAQRRHPYTAGSVQKFLDWDETRVHFALQGLELIELKLLREKDLEQLGYHQARALITETHKAREYREQQARAVEKIAKEAARLAEEADDTETRRRETKRAEVATRQAGALRAEGRQVAKAVGREIGDSMRGGSLGHRHVGTKAVEIQQRDFAKKTAPPWIEDFAARLTSDIAKILDVGDARADRLDKLISVKEYLPSEEGEDLQKTLKNLATRATQYATKLEGYGKSVERINGRSMKALR